MSAKRRPEPAGSPVRGAVLVAVAVVLGFVLIRNGFDSPTQTVASNGRDRTTTTNGATSTTRAPRAASEVKVLVANSSGVDGAAGRFTTTLSGKGYQMGTATNAPRVETTSVFFQKGFKPEAQAVATAIGGTAAMAKPMPAAPPAELLGANILVQLGPDVAA